VEKKKNSCHGMVLVLAHMLTTNVTGTAECLNVLTEGGSDLLLLLAWIQRTIWLLVQFNIASKDCPNASPQLSKLALPLSSMVLLMFPNCTIASNGRV